jgi:hypothetical protein
MLHLSAKKYLSALFDVVFCAEMFGLLPLRLNVFIQLVILFLILGCKVKTFF